MKLNKESRKGVYNKGKREITFKRPRTEEGKRLKKMSQVEKPVVLQNSEHMALVRLAFLIQIALKELLESA